MTLWCIGRNYARHAAELGNAVPKRPLIFLKPPSALRGVEPSPIAPSDEGVEHECELVVRVGRPVPLGASGAWTDLDGVGVGLDLTRRATQATCKQRGWPWTRAKAFAGSAVVGTLHDPATLGDPRDWTFGLDVDGRPRQRGAARDMLVPIPDLIGFIAELSPLQPGDLIFTGTPEGVGPLPLGTAFDLWLKSGDAEYRDTGRL